MILCWLNILALKTIIKIKINSMLNFVKCILKENHHITYLKKINFKPPLYFINNDTHIHVLKVHRPRNTLLNLWLVESWKSQSDE